MSPTIELTSISPHGIWIFVGNSEYFVPFELFPWFRDAKINDIYDVEVLHGDHLFWKNLDVDLSINQLINPDMYPLVYRA